MNLRSSAAFGELVGASTYVKVEIGYASGWLFGGFTIEISPLPVTLPTEDAAALMLRRPGSVNFFAAFCTRANLSLFASAYATSAYVMPPSVRATTPVTPALPRAPIPVGHSTVVPVPTLPFQVGLVFVRKSVKLYEVPELSER